MPGPVTFRVDADSTLLDDDWILAARFQDEGAASIVKSWNDLISCVQSKGAAIRKAS